MKDINITFIRYFVTLVECKKFNAAAYQLHISQPALSKSIMILEEQLGTSLLKRFPRGFELTDAGRYFYETGVYFLKLYEDFLYDIDSRVRSPYSGTIRISASGVVLDTFFPDIILKLGQEYPSIKIFAKEEDTSNTIQSLQAHKADFGTALYPLPDDIRDQFCAYHLLGSSYHIVLLRDHPFAAKDCININELNGINILTPGEFSRVHQSFAKLCKEHSVQPNIICSCSQIQFLLKLISAGVGIAVLPAVFVSSLPPDLVHRPLIPPLPWNLGIVYPKDSFLPLAASTAIDFIKKYFASLSINRNDGSAAADPPEV